MGNDLNKPTRKFGLFTTIAMIVGIVIGSGIFFKTPEILRDTNGNILIGASAFLVAALSIIFGGLTISNYAEKDETVGGLVSYCDLAWGKTIGYLAGFFQTILYYPAIIAVVAWVAASYTFGLFGWDCLLINGVINNNTFILTFLYLTFFYLLNTIQTKKAGTFQSVTMVIKVASLAVLAILGLAFGNPSSIAENYSEYHATSSGFFAALIAVSFAMDGWMIVPSIAHEIKDSRNVLTKALIISPIIITIIYLLYYIGISSFGDMDAVLAGIDPLGIMAAQIFGSMGSKVIYLFVIISILGTVNGCILGYIRVPYALALRSNAPYAKTLSKVNAKYDTPINASVFCYIATLIMLLLHMASLNGFGIFAGLEVDNLPIVMNYFFLAVLYIGVMVKPAFKNLSFAKRYIIPGLAVIGAAVIIYGGAAKAHFNVYMAVSLVIIAIGYFTRPSRID